MINRLLRSHRFRQVIALGAGTALGQLAIMLASPIWSRLYNPKDFGGYGLILSFLTTSTVAVSLRYDMAVPLARTQQESYRLVILSTACSVPVSLMAGTLYVFLCVKGYLGYGAVSPWSVVFVVTSLLLTSIFSTLRFLYIRDSDFGGISRSLVSQGIGRAVTPIILAPFKLGWMGLVAGEMIGRSVGIRKLAATTAGPILRTARETTGADLRALILNYRQYPMIFLPSSILDAASAAVALPVLVALYGVAAGGEFLLAQQVVMAPAALMAGSLGDVFHAKLMPTSRGSPSDLPLLVKRTAARLLLASALIYLPFGVAAPFLAVPVFGPSWSGVGHIVAILSPAFAVTVAVSTVSRAMVLSRIPQLKFAADFAKLSLPIAGLVLGSHYGDASLSLIAYSIMVIVSYSIYFLVILISIRVTNQLPETHRMN